MPEAVMGHNANIPAHIPADLVFDFDYFRDPQKGGDVQKGILELRERAPDVFWTPRNGGHWVVTRMDHLRAVMTAPELFSSDKPPPSPAHSPVKMEAPPQDLDPPHHMPYRMAIMRFLGPKEVAKLEPSIRALINRLIDDVASKGHCEFKYTVAIPFPARTFMSLMGMDLSRDVEFFGWVDAILCGMDQEKKANGFREMAAYLGQLIAQRIAQPGDDAVSLLLRTDVNGQRLTPQKVHAMCSLLFLAGLDTVTNALTFIVHYLAQHPEAQQQLRSNPATIPNAVEEFMRRFSFVNLPRRVREDTDMFGVPMRTDDMLVCCLAGASNDSAVFADPLRVDFKRENTAHVAFNTGPHLCAGASLARLELRIFLEEWLRRMPDVTLAPGFVATSRGGPVMALDRLEIAWPV